jgi:hypothetical protein
VTAPATFRSYILLFSKKPKLTMEWS